MPISENSKSNVESNWASDAYQALVVQRNILIFLLVIALIIIAVTSFILSDLARSKEVKPFVVQIDKLYGIPTVVNPTTNHQLISNEALNRYFIVTYVKSRETFDPNMYKYYYYTVTRLFSIEKVFWGFRKYVEQDPSSPLARFVQDNNNPDRAVSTKFKLRSIQFFHDQDGHKAVIRFSLVDANTNNIVANKIATLTYDYAQMELSTEDRLINPLGFQILSYRSDDENL